MIKLISLSRSPLLYSHPPCQEQVPQDEEHEGCCDEFMTSLGRCLPVNFGCWIVVFVWCNYLSILYRTLLYINDVTFVSVPWVIICVRLDPSTHLISRPGFRPLKSGCDNHKHKHWQTYYSTGYVDYQIPKSFRQMDQGPFSLPPLWSRLLDHASPYLWYGIVSHPPSNGFL